ncbi:MAG: Holliday junction branch migration protein RuvA [Solitalea-like symbiont of Acarus siro]
MISYIKGKIVYKSPTYIILEVNNIGYHIKISLNTYEQLNNQTKEPDASTLILTLVHIKEDAHTIYGFCSEHERYLFKQLITVNGIGYSTANIALSYLTPSELEEAILAARVDIIKKIKGIGEKSASRIVLELKDKLTKTNSTSISQANQIGSQNKDLAQNALVALGFSRAMVEKIVNKIYSNTITDKSVEALVKEALKQL